MEKISFKNDYSEGAHPKIIKALQDTNFLQDEGYGLDLYSKSAKKLIQEKLGNNSDIHIVSGGTQANLIVISSILKPYESVISANTGHITVHEAGSIESTGHKVNVIDSKNGKLSSEDIKIILDLHTDEHMVKPKLVYISNTTEIGTVYKKRELEDLSNFCNKNDLYLFMDGARIASALTSKYNDVDFKDLSNLVDVFYIGGTKNGALLGEAIVINNLKLKENFRFYLKQKGALLAKGRILGIQFLELFKENLFLELGLHANKMAINLVKAIEKKGYKFFIKPESNQIFPILPNSIIKKLEKDFDFYIWEKLDKNNSVIRLVTSWATKEEYVQKFIITLNNI